MKTIVEPAYETPLVSFQISSRTGTVNEPLGKEGLVCHSAELGMRGTQTLSRAQFDEKIDSLGASMSFSFRRDSMALSATCLHRHLDTVFSLAVDVLSSPALSGDEHEKLQRESLSDLDEMRDSDAALAARYFNRHFHPGYIYCRTAIGTKRTISELTLEEVRMLYPKLFPDSDLVFGIAGPISETDAEALATKLPSSGASALPLPDLTPPEAPAGLRLILVDKPGRKQCQVAMGHLMPAYGSDSFDALRVAEVAFGGMFSSRLMQEIRVNQAWSYGASCNIYQARGSHALCITMAPATEVCPAAIAKVMEMYSELHANGITADEFDFTRSYLTGSAAFGRATPTQRLYGKIQEELYSLPKGYGDSFAQRIKALDLAGVNAALSQSAKPKDLCVVVVASADTALAELETLGFDSIEVIDYASY